MLFLPIISKGYDLPQFESVYRAMRSKDLSDCVVTALKVLKETNMYMNKNFKLKSTSEALKLGIEGKRAFCEGNYQQAIVKYNMALQRAPHDSEAMVLAYYSRAELLLETERFSYCLKDIETCLTMNCPDNMGDKLQKMKEEASKYTWMEKIVHEQLRSPFSDKFFKLKGAHNPDIPCVSSDVEIIMDSPKPKIVAAKDIPVGTVLALETAFVSAPHLMNHITSCHYCHKMTFNLMPCDGCCDALFCDKHCKDQSMQEGHNVECKIIDIILPDAELCIKAVIKMRQMCSSWDELISASIDLGVDRMKNSSVSNIFGSHKFSLLNSHNDTHFIYGAMFNTCLYLANVIHYLDIKTSFLPKSPEHKSAAIRAISRIMMHLSLYSTPQQLQPYTYVTTESMTTLHNHPNKGYFPFIGKLSNSCLPNSYMLGIRNSGVLVALMPIKQGTELTVSYTGHWLELKEHDALRAHKLLIHYRSVCSNCIICSSKGILPKQLLNDTQMKAYQEFVMNETMTNLLHNRQTIYMKTCKTLQSLREVPCSKEYHEVFRKFVLCLIHFIHCQFPNVIFQRYD